MIRLCKEGEGKIPASAQDLEIRRGGKRIRLRGNRLAAKELKLFDRCLDQAPSTHAQNPGQGQAVGPIFLIRGVGHIRKAHPGDEDRAVLVVVDRRGALCGIGVKAPVQDVEPAKRREGERIKVHVSQKVPVVVLRVSPSLDGEVLGTEEQDVGAVDALDGGALPHVAEILKAGDLQLSRKGPAGEGLF